MDPTPFRQENPCSSECRSGVVGNESVDCVQKSIRSVVVEKRSMDFISDLSVKRGIHVTPEGGEQIRIFDDGKGGREEGGVVGGEGTVE